MLSKFAVGLNTQYTYIWIIFVHSYTPNYLEQNLACNRQSFNIIINKRLEGAD